MEKKHEWVTVVLGENNLTFKPENIQEFVYTPEGCGITLDSARYYPLNEAQFNFLWELANASNRVALT